MNVCARKQISLLSTFFHIVPVHICMCWESTTHNPICTPFLTIFDNNCCFCNTTAAMQYRRRVCIHAGLHACIHKVRQKHRMHILTLANSISSIIIYECHHPCIRVYVCIQDVAAFTATIWYFLLLHFFRINFLFHLHIFFCICSTQKSHIQSPVEKWQEGCVFRKIRKTFFLREMEGFEAGAWLKISIWRNIQGSLILWKILFRTKDELL